MPRDSPGLGQDAKTKLKVWMEEGMDWKGWKTPQLAQKSDLSRQTVSRLVNRKIEPTEDTLIKLARALERPLPAAVAERVSESPEAYLGGVSKYLEFRAREALNILDDAVIRVKVVLDGAGDLPAKTTQATIDEASEEINGLEERDPPAEDGPHAAS